MSVVPRTALDAEIASGRVVPHVVKIDAEREEVRVLEGAHTLFERYHAVPFSFNAFGNTASVLLRHAHRPWLRDLDLRWD